MVTAMDDAIGQVTRALEDNGYMDNLIIVFTTDVSHDTCFLQSPVSKGVF